MAPALLRAAAMSAVAVVPVVQQERSAAAPSAPAARVAEAPAVEVDAVDGSLLLATRAPRHRRPDPVPGGLGAVAAGVVAVLATPSSAVDLLSSVDGLTALAVAPGLAVAGRHGPAWLAALARALLLPWAWMLGLAGGLLLALGVRQAQLPTAVTGMLLVACAWRAMIGGRAGVAR